MHIIQYRLLRVVFIFVVVCMAVGCGRSPVTFVTEQTGDTSLADTQEEPEVSQTVTEAGSEAAEQAYIPVYVCGAVCRPGVYYLPIGSIKQEALEQAGGFTEDAGRDYVNLAETVSEGEQIYFPTQAELNDWQIIPDTDDGQAEDSRVNINTATREQLMTLQGIGESKAEAIIAYRNQHGPFQTKEDLLNVSGIKEGVYQGIKDYIVVD